MNFTGYCIVHELCTVFVFESDYADRAGIARNMGRIISDVFAYPRASFDFECFAIGSSDGQNIWDIAEQIAHDTVGQFAFCDSVPEYTLHCELVTISPVTRSKARIEAAQHGLSSDMTNALVNALCAVYGAGDESEISAEFHALIDSMTGYYN